VIELVGIKNQSALTQFSNPYLAARAEWDERYGDLIARARNWRVAAILALLIAGVEAGGMIAVSMRSKTVPFVVAVDSVGRVVASGPAEQAPRIDDRMKRAAMFQWVQDLRLVTTDPIAQRKSIDRVYAMIASGSAAQTFVSDYYRNDPPFARAQKETVDVQVRTVIPTSEVTYEVEWTETTRDLSGDVLGTQNWKGAFTIAINPPSDERLARVNPLGLYVTNASWSKIL
jgi:type IV secretion system protein VirB5